MLNSRGLKHFFSSRFRSQWLWFGAALWLGINGWFVANLRNYPELRRVADRPEIAIVSVVFVLVFALPSFIGVVRWLGWRRGAALLLSLGCFAILIETLALRTGWPYGRFVYGDKIGAKLPGGVPWTVSFAWSPLLLCAMPLAHRALKSCPLSRIVEPTQYGRIRRCLWAAALVTAFDLALDPGAVSQRYWSYEAGGAYYGVPLSNFAGWLVSGFLGALLFSVFARDQTPPRSLMTSGLLILIFWTAVCAWSNLWLAALAGAAMLIVCFRHLWRTDL